MANSIYLTSAEGRTGKSAIALGVLDTLLAEAPRVGVFRPMIREGQERDRVLELLLDYAGQQLAYEDCVGVTYHEVHDNPDTAMTTIVEKFKKLEEQCDAILIVGSDYTDVAAPTEFSFNAKLAANLGAPVLLTLGGRSHQQHRATLGQLPPRSAEDLARVAEIAEQELAHAHASLIGIIVNRADPEAVNDIHRAVNATVEGETPVWVIPEDILLVAPQVHEVIAALDGTLLRGDTALVSREVQDIVVAGMSMERVLPRLIEGSAVVIAADRSETLLAVTMAHEADTFPTIAAIIVNGDTEVSADVMRLLDGVGSKLPIVRAPYGTFETAQRVTETSGLLSRESPLKFDKTLRLFREHIDTDALRSLIELHSGEVVTPVMFAYELFDRATRTGAHIVLPEASDDRILRAASTLIARGVCELTLLGDENLVRQRGSELGLALDGAHIVDPRTSPLRNVFAAEYVRLRAHKGVGIDEALERMLDHNYFGTMMVHLGHASGMVSGAVGTTANTIRPSFEIIKTRPGVSVVSSVFFMALADRVLVYGDCAVIPDPTADELADIAISSAKTAAEFGVDPRIAMLSYSTGDSGTGEDVDKVRRATAIVRDKAPALMIDGPIQYDAASDPATGAAKLPGSKVAGRATVFIFPDLNTGNNTYKAVQRSAGAVAVGPVLQGLNKPVNDLSRGATVEDILNTVAITAVQSGTPA